MIRIVGTLPSRSMQALSIEIATPDEARAQLGLQGKAKAGWK